MKLHYIEQTNGHYLLLQKKILVYYKSFYKYCKSF